MKIVSAEYMISVADASQYPEDKYPEIALVGRSNVGKSSLINKLAGRRNLARTSNTPGKTQYINYYCINDCYYWVDLPGYGFARVSKKKRREWQVLIEEYLKNRKTLRGIIQLVDIRHPPTNDDLQMYQWLQYYELPTVLVATKADKISRGLWSKHLKIIRDKLLLDAEVPLLVFSALKGIGVKELREEIDRLMA